MNKVDEVLRMIERNSWGRRYPIIGPIKGKKLGEIVRQNKPKRILEVGTLVGYSTIVMGKELDVDGEIITIEIDTDKAERARMNIHEAELRPNIRVIVGDALDVLPTLQDEFDMVFLDAAKHEYLYYLKLVEDQIHKGSIIVSDNVGQRRI